MPDAFISPFPVTCSDGECSIVAGLEIDDFSRARIDASVAELVAERPAVVHPWPPRLLTPRPLTPPAPQRLGG